VPSIALTLPQTLAYGALGMPLAFVALPLYVHWPSVASSALGLSLTSVGLILLLVRCADAVVDPWIGRVADARFERAGSGAWWLAALACVAIVVGFAMAFGAGARESAGAGVGLGAARTAGVGTWVSMMAALALATIGYSVAQIVHQSWAARFGGDARRRTRAVAAREVFALVGVVVASWLPTQFGWGSVTLVLAMSMVVALAALRLAPNPALRESADANAGAHGDEAHEPSGWPLAAVPTDSSKLWSPWRHGEFRSLMVAFVLSGLASAIPATLFLFFVRDRLQAPHLEGAFLLLYFAAGALSVPLWSAVVARRGLIVAWIAAGAVAVASFVGASMLGAGDVAWFALICAGSGLALGADVVVPAALLAGVIQRSGAHGRDEGLWFGWWNFATKLTLALGAGLALPLVQWLGYTPGAASTSGLQALTWIYAALPCAIKIAALAMIACTRWGEPATDAAPGPVGGTSSNNGRSPEVAR
jgi:glycoside/pentoside/hexuronide:cation symporter, GPH family